MLLYKENYEKLFSFALMFGKKCRRFFYFSVVTSSLLKYKKFFKHGARKFHFLKYKKLFTFEAWKVTSWNIRNFFGASLSWNKKNFFGVSVFRKTSFFWENIRSFLGDSVSWNIRIFLILELESSISQKYKNFI